MTPGTVEAAPLVEALIAEHARRRDASGLDRNDYSQTGESQGFGAAVDIVLAHLDAAPEAPQSVADQLAAAGAIIARLTSLLQQPRPHMAPLPYLPNEVPAALQVPAMQLLKAVGLDMHGRPVEAK